MPLPSQRPLATFLAVVHKGSLKAFALFFMVPCNLPRTLRVRTIEAQASITVYLFSFNSGRVARRSDPLFFLPKTRCNRCPDANACPCRRPFARKLWDGQVARASGAGQRRAQASSKMRVMSACLLNPTASACCGMMLCSLKPGTALISMTWGSPPGSSIMSTRAMPCMCKVR